MGCHYCNCWAGRKLSEKAVCEDCYQTVHAVPDEERVGVLTERLQKVHGMLLKHPQRDYIANWVKELAQRLEYLSGVLPEPVVEEPARVVAAAPELEAPYEAPKQTSKLPKPLKIRKLR